MTRFLIVASYTAEGIRGVLEQGGSARRDAVGKTLAGLGGRLVSFDFAFGSDDVYAVAELPDNVSAAAVGMSVAASGLVTARIVVLLTPEEIDAAAKTKVAYRAPGT